MELAVCLSKYAAEKNPLDLIDSFAKGETLKPPSSTLTLRTWALKIPMVMNLKPQTLNPKP
jgi:hypothetical protein